MTRLATYALVLAALCGGAALAGADVELLRFGWPPPLILDATVLGWLFYRLGHELGDLDTTPPIPEPVSEELLP